MFALLVACSSEPAPYWGDQLAPSGPCYAFDLTDGVEPGDTSELHAAFACLNRQGTVQPLARVDAALDGATRSGTVAGALGDTLSAWAGLDSVSIAGLLDAGLALLDDRAAVEPWIGIGLEWVYAAPVGQLGTGVSINSSTALSAGVVVPLVTSAGEAATATLDADLAPLGPGADALRSAELRRWAWSLALLPEADDAGLAALGAGWADALAELVVATANPANDHAPGPTGNSLRDAALALVGGTGVVDVVAAAGPLLRDDHARDALVRWVEDEEAAGRWARLDAGVAHLASVDRDGGTLTAGEDSALVALVRLFHDANRPVECRVDLVITDLEIDLGNLAVALLEALAALDPDTAADGVAVLGHALGYGLTDTTLGLVADSGVCPVIDAEFAADLGAVDRLGDDEAQDLLRSLIGFLGAADDHLDAVADAATVVHEAALVDPVGELVLDLEGREATAVLLAAVPGLLDPDLRVADGFPAGVRPVDVDSVFDLVLAVGEPATWAALEPALAALVAAPSTWTAVDNSARLLGDERAATRALLPRLRELLEADPTLGVADTAAELVDTPAVARPAAELVESAALREALVSTALDDPGPLPWIAELYVGGTLAVVWDTLALFRPLLGATDA